MLNKRPYARKPRISAHIARTFVIARRRTKKRVRAIPLVRVFGVSTAFAGELNFSASGPARTALAIDKAGADS
jgi:hypothetical protein